MHRSKIICFASRIYDLVWDFEMDKESTIACLTVLKESPLIKNLSINIESYLLSLFVNRHLDLSIFNHLERLELDSYYERTIFGPTHRLPSSLRRCTFNHHHGNDSLLVPLQYLQSIESCPLLEDLMLIGLRLSQVQFLQRFSNLKRLHFRDIAFNSGITNRVEGLPLEWINFEECKDGWSSVAEILIKASNVKMIVLKLKQDSQELRKTLNRLAPLIMAKNASLELTINEPGGIISVTAFEFCHILTKLELISHNYGLKSILIGKSFDKLTLVKATNCPGLDDSDLAAVAEWCFNLEEFYFKPDKKNRATSHCLKPFFTSWDNRESKQLSIECIRTDLAFGWFQGQADQEKGVFEDGKFWMRYGNSAFSKKPEDGSIRVGKRMIIWDQNEKKMVIRDYEKDFGQKLQISMESDGCHVKKVMNI